MGSLTPPSPLTFSTGLNPLGRNKDQSSSSNEVSSEVEVIVFIPPRRRDVEIPEQLLNWLPFGGRWGVGVGDLGLWRGFLGEGLGMQVVLLGSFLSHPTVPLSPGGHLSAACNEPLKVRGD